MASILAFFGNKNPHINLNDKLYPLQYPIDDIPKKLMNAVDSRRPLTKEINLGKYSCNASTPQFTPRPRNNKEFFACLSAPTYKRSNFTGDEKIKIMYVVEKADGSATASVKDIIPSQFSVEDLDFTLASLIYKTELKKDQVDYLKALQLKAGQSI